jgi:hypothetical protein
MFKKLFLLAYFAFMAGCVDTATANCPVFPKDNVWNTPIDQLPVHKFSPNWVRNIGAGGNAHFDFASGKWEGKEIGIPVNYVKGNYYSAFYKFLYASESDNVKYPVNPATGGVGIKIEEGSDRHMIAVDENTCTLYELFNTREQDLEADSGARFDLRSNAMRPDEWTSADAAGLPILPGLVRYEEVEAGEIKHALRFTVPMSRGYIWPASHLTAGKKGELYDFNPPLGAWFRLKADYDISGFDPKVRVILTALKKYGMILADNGAPWFISGSPDARWNDELLGTVRKIRGSAFEAVDASCLKVADNSYAANLSNCLPKAPVIPKTVPPAGKSFTSTITIPKNATQLNITIRVAQ